MLRISQINYNNKKDVEIFTLGHFNSAGTNLRYEIPDTPITSNSQRVVEAIEGVPVPELNLTRIADGKMEIKLMGTLQPDAATTFVLGKNKSANINITFGTLTKTAVNATSKTGVKHLYDNITLVTTIEVTGDSVEPQFAYICYPTDKCPLIKVNVNTKVNPLGAPVIGTYEMKDGKWT